MVSLVLAIVVFGMGMMFFADIFQEASDVKTRLDSQTDQQIRNILLSTGEKVAIPFDKKEINGGDTATFGVGIFNVPGPNAPTNFKIEKSGTDFCKCFKKDNTACPTSPTAVVGDQGLGQILKIKPNQQRVAVVGIEVGDVDIGSNIICTIKVTDVDHNKQYGSTQQVYIQV